MTPSHPNRIEALQDLEPTVDEFLGSVIRGLSAPQKSLPCKFFYDERGSQLFDEICDLPEYYPTRTELRILENHAGDIAALAGPAARVVELGSGAGVKIRLLLHALQKPAAYLPVEISREHMMAANEAIATHFPDLPILPVCAYYTKPSSLPEPPRIRFPQALGLFPGSTTGNFTRQEAVNCLRITRKPIAHRALIIDRVGLAKDIDILH